MNDNNKNNCNKLEFIVYRGWLSFVILFLVLIYTLSFANIPHCVNKSERNYIFIYIKQNKNTKTNLKEKNKNTKIDRNSQGRWITSRRYQFCHALTSSDSTQNIWVYFATLHNTRLLLLLHTNVWYWTEACQWTFVTATYVVGRWSDPHVTVRTNPTQCQVSAP